MMGNMTLTEQALVEALSQWTTKQGIVLVQINSLFFMQVLREQGLEIVKAEELIKIRYQHKALKEQVDHMFKTANAAKMLVQQLDTKDLVKEHTITESKTQTPKATSKRTTPR